MPAEQIVYRELESSLGKLIIGATSLCCCLLKYEDRGGLIKILHRFTKQYKLEMTRGTNAFLEQLELELKQYFKGSRQNFSVPLDVGGTPFQRAAWAQLLNIPCGQTKTYGEIARLVGRPLAVRAIGRANGDNPLAVVLPCHRVIQHDGKLRGYGGGLWRKEYLLTLENRHKQQSPLRVLLILAPDRELQQFPPEVGDQEHRRHPVNERNENKHDVDETFSPARHGDVDLRELACLRFDVCQGAGGFQFLGQPRAADLGAGRCASTFSFVRANSAKISSPDWPICLPPPAVAE